MNRPLGCPQSVDSDSSTVVALKILSCVLRVHEELGREKVAKILAGSEDNSVEPYKALSTYGLLSDYSIKRVSEMIDYLISEEYIAQQEGHRFPTHGFVRRIPVSHFS